MSSSATEEAVDSDSKRYLLPITGSAAAGICLGLGAAIGDTWPLGTGPHMGDQDRDLLVELDLLDDGLLGSQQTTP